MNEYQRYMEKVSHFRKYTLLSGNQILVIESSKGIRCYQCSPNEPWEPMAPEIAQLIPLYKIAMEIEDFES